MDKHKELIPNIKNKKPVANPKHDDVAPTILKDNKEENK